MAGDKKNFNKPVLLVIMLVLIILTVFFVVTRCQTGPGGNPGLEEPDRDGSADPGESPGLTERDLDYSADLVSLEQFDPRDYAEEDIPPSDCSLAARLYIADGPGKPLIEEEEPQASQTSQGGFSVQPIPFAASILPGRLSLVTTQITPIKPIYPIPINPPSPLVQVLNPEAGSSLEAGSNFTLEWTIDSGRELTVDILFSADGGATYQDIALGIENTSSFKLKVPDVTSDSCVFRVNAWVGTSLLGYNHSPIFKVVPPPPPPSPPPPPETPSPPPEEAEPALPPPPPVFIEDDSAFIFAGGDASRWFAVEHDLPNVARMVWQMSRIPFPCGPDALLFEAPGLLASAPLAGDVKEFKIDFASILERIPGTGEAEPAVNKGISFELVPGVVLSKQTQRDLYVRVVLLDEKDRVIGITRSGFQVLYGAPGLDLTAIDHLLFRPDLPRPELTIRTEAGFGPGWYEPIPEKGKFLYAGGNRDWKFELTKIPGDSVEIDLQISTVPFHAKNLYDYQNPSGLVYRSRVTGLSSSVATRWYPVSFSEFAPPLFQLGPNTIRYYIRAVCYVPGDVPGTVFPITTKTDSIYYTGDQQVFLLSRLDLDNLPPEEVEVKSYVPKTQFRDYYPARWPLKDYQEYFEVTRPIQAEEMSFFIKNNQTGDFLFPYPTHMSLYPNTTRAEYQATLDRMLPPKAWFHLTINLSSWDAFWGEFFDLLTQIYAGIQKHYNGLKYTVANVIADRFAFLGPSVQGYIRTAVTALIDYGLASVGLPPSLPNFEALADAGLDYCTRVALGEAAQLLDVPVDQVPDDVRKDINDEVRSQLQSMAGMKNVNPLKVGYLKPATEAMYRPAWVDIAIFNPHEEPSPTGTLTLSYYPKDKPHFKIFKYVSLPVPSLPHHGYTTIRVYLTPSNTDKPVWKEYYWGDIGECTLNLTVTYDVPDIETAAKEQGVRGISEHRPDAYYYDIDPVYTFTKTGVPGERMYRN